MNIELKERSREDLLDIISAKDMKIVMQNIEIERLNNIIKEVREYIENNSYFEGNAVKTMIYQDYSIGILEILDKGE